MLTLHSNRERDSNLKFVIVVHYTSGQTGTIAGNKSYEKLVSYKIKSAARREIKGRRNALSLSKEIEKLSAPYRSTTCRSTCGSQIVINDLYEEELSFSFRKIPFCGLSASEMRALCYIVV